VTTDAGRAVRESLVLPALFLSVAAAGGFRVTTWGEVRFLTPSLFSLILAALLMGALVQSRLLRPARLVAGRATFLESCSGAWLCATLFIASAQILNGLVPEQGLLALLFNLFLAVLLTSTIAAAPDKARVLRSLAVTFGWALLMKYVMLAGLVGSDQGFTARLLRALVHGATLGGLPVDAWSDTVGYVMFGAAGLYLLGLWLVGRVETQQSPAV
jgi:hypothetical protein